MLDVHDNEIISYNVDYKKQKLTLNTTDYKDENIIIEFQGFLTHKFELGYQQNVISDLEEHGIEAMIEENEELLKETKCYCWPMYFDNLEHLKEKLKANQYKYYVIESSIGLCGWVLARNMEILKI